MEDFLRRQTEPSQIYWTRRHIPELGDVLGAEENGVLLPDQSRNCAGGLRAERVIRLSSTEQNIRVNQGHASVIATLIDFVAAPGVIGQDRRGPMAGRPSLKCGDSFLG
jgi:hypothetical protein